MPYEGRYEHSTLLFPVTTTDDDVHQQHLYAPQAELTAVVPLYQVAVMPPFTHICPELLQQETRCCEQYLCLVTGH